MNNIPKSFVSGDDLEIDLSATREQFPTEDYSLLFVVSVSGRYQQTELDDSRLLSIGWRVTKKWSGSIPWRLYAVGKVRDERKTISSGFIQILEPFAAYGTAQEDPTPKTHEEKVLAAIEAVLENQATHEQLSISINGRSLMRRSTTELFELRQKYRDLVVQAKAREKAGGKIVFGKIRLKTPRD